MLKIEFSASVSEISYYSTRIYRPSWSALTKNKAKSNAIDYKESSNDDLYSEFVQTNSNNELITYRLDIESSSLCTQLMKICVNLYLLIVANGQVTERTKS